MYLDFFDYLEVKKIIPYIISVIVTILIIIGGIIVGNKYLKEDKDIIYQSEEMNAEDFEKEELNKDTNLKKQPKVLNLDDVKSTDTLENNSVQSAYKEKEIESAIDEFIRITQ